MNDINAKDIVLKLASFFQLCALKGWDNWTYTHISARDETGRGFYINPFGLLFKDVTPGKLVHVDMGLSSKNYFDAVNPTGVHIHKSIYQKRPDVNCIVHLHTPYGVAVSCIDEGLMPLSQFALHFYGRITRHRYDSLVLDEIAQTEKLAQDLGEHFAMLLDNHGTLTAGRTIEEAFFHTHHLEEACRVQCLALNAHTKPILLTPDVCAKAVNDLLGFEFSLGLRDFNAAQSLIPLEIREGFMKEADGLQCLY